MGEKKISRNEEAALEWAQMLQMLGVTHTFPTSCFNYEVQWQNSFHFWKNAKFGDIEINV